MEIPEGKRTSGKLGKVIKEKVKEYDEPLNEMDTAVLEIITYITNPLTEESAIKLYLDAIMETPLS